MSIEQSQLATNGLNGSSPVSSVNGSSLGNGSTAGNGTSHLSSASLVNAIAPVSGAFVLPPLDVRRKRPPFLSFLLRMHTLRRIGRVVSLLALDYVGVVGALFTALIVKEAIVGSVDVAAAWRQTDAAGAFAYLVTVLMFARVDLYADRPRRPGLVKIATALFQVTIVSLLFALANGNHFSSYYVFYGSLLFGTAYITALRAIHLKVTGWVLERAGYSRRALLVGPGRKIGAVAQALSGLSRTKVNIVGYISPSPCQENGLRSLGRLEDLPAVVAAERVEEVIIADPDFDQERAVELVDMCHRRGVAVHVAPSTMEVLFDRAQFVPGQSVPLFTLRPPVFEGIDYTLKRTVDLILSAIGLVVLAPLLLVVALAVKLSSRGPVIYRSMRPGIGGRPFYCFKFRTMRDHADQLQVDLEPLNEKSGALFKIKHDPRVTPVGRVLRRFSLDELPQLVNVIRGEMSLVGPRPLPMRDFERLEEWHKKRYLVLPGITGLWQVSGRSELDFDDLVRLDFLYLERWSVLLDLSILLKTLPIVLTRRGAF
jgi:exopolysaccharide biosynthesis polyprenyl glycosylphosphotransferase